MQTLKIDAEFKALIPAMSVDEYNGLEQSLLTEGCRDALVVWDNILIDGHNRYEICQKHGIVFKTVGMDFENRDEVKAWRIINFCKQDRMKKLPPIDRVFLAVKLKKIWSAQKKEKQARKNKWIQESYNTFTKSEKQPCFICGKYKHFCDAHHLIPLAEQYNLGLKKPNHTHVWLCPTHHAITHYFMKCVKDIRKDIGAEFSTEELSSLSDIFQKYIDLKAEKGVLV